MGPLRLMGVMGNASLDGGDMVDRVASLDGSDMVDRVASLDGGDG